MGNQLLNSVVVVATAIIGVAIVAVLVSKNANTSAVIGASSQGFSQALGTALSPVTGSGNSFGNQGGGVIDTI